MCHPDRGDLAKLPMLLLPGYPTREVCCLGGDARKHVWAEPVLSGSKAVQGLAASSTHPHACAARHRLPAALCPLPAAAARFRLSGGCCQCPPGKSFAGPDPACVSATAQRLCRKQGCDPNEGGRVAPVMIRGRGQPLSLAFGHDRAVGPRGSGATAPWMEETEAL